MQLFYEMLDGDILKITLDGRLDVDGTNGVDVQLRTLAATKRTALLLDLHRVDFLASIGIRTLLICAKTAARRGGAMVLVRPRPMVRAVLDRSGVSSLIPVYADTETALGAIARAGGERREAEQNAGDRRSPCRD